MTTTVEHQSGLFSENEICVEGREEVTGRLPAWDTVRLIGDWVDGVAPAFANALHDAAGIRLTQFPITSERVYAALQATASHESGHHHD